MTLSETSGEQVTVAYATTGDTATAGTDYTTVNETLTLMENTTTQTLTVSVRGDSDSEEDETFTVTLSSPSGAMLSDSEATGTILNDDRVVAVKNLRAEPGNRQVTLRWDPPRDASFTNYYIRRRIGGPEGDIRYRYLAPGPPTTGFVPRTATSHVAMTSAQHLHI